MKGKINTKYILLVLTIISFLLHFWNINYPEEVVFDEVHYGKSAHSYFTGKFHFDGHPPLAKLLISLGGLLGGFKPTDFYFVNISDKFPDPGTMSLRFMPSLFGSLLPLLIYLILRNLGISKKTSLLGFLLIMLENSLLVQSRFILIDVFLLLFGFLGVLFFIIGKKQKSTKKTLIYYIISGLSIGSSVGVKWTALIFWLTVFIFALIEPIKLFIKGGYSRKLVNSTAIFIVSFVLVPFLVYAFIFAIHFSLLPYSGDGDVYMSQKFKSTLIGSPDYRTDSQINFLDKFVELNLVSWSSNVENLLTPHPYSSTWYNMPFMYRPIYYWTKSLPEGQARIYFIGNPVIWWSVLISSIFFTAIIGKKLIRKSKGLKKLNQFHLLLLFGFWGNILFFILIKRVIFLYHYLPSMIFGIILMCYLLDKFFMKNKAVIFGQQIKTSKILWVFIVLVVAGFLFFTPLTYGFPLQASMYKLLIWMPSWI